MNVAASPRMFPLANLSLMWLQSFTSTFERLCELDHCSPAGVLTCSQRLDSVLVLLWEAPQPSTKTPVRYDVIGSANTSRRCRREDNGDEQQSNSSHTFIQFFKFVFGLYFIFRLMRYHMYFTYTYLLLTYT